MPSAPCSGPSPDTARIPRPAGAANKKMACLCSPTSHPGSFRCSRHRTAPDGAEAVPGATRARSVRALLLQRIGGIRREPGRHHRRRGVGVGDFQPRPSRLRLMNL
ncbi:hypothetical protein ZEAMMB73_Zm00001d052016 [Zea mays]|uniref:Uncharacterized protein n=1 Tax=Zea mays TaxID=4577 RepID=K7U970_MAIZE|nr:hypothetical protein ZEAMMB73_Zm00001d052016 [Zea mays]